MSKTVIHTDDLPAWAVRQERQPQAYLTHLMEPTYPAPDGEQLESIEDKILRCQFEAMLRGDAVARNWLLKKIMKENEALLKASAKYPTVIVDGAEHFQPLGPVLALLGCAEIHDPEIGSNDAPTISLVPWFLAFLAKLCRPEKLAPVLAWLDAGGRQDPLFSRPNPDMVE